MSNLPDDPVAVHSRPFSDGWLEVSGGKLYYPGKEVGQAFQPDKAQSQAGSLTHNAFPSCRGNTQSRQSRLPLTKRVIGGHFASDDDFIALVLSDVQGVQFRSLG